MKSEIIRGPSHPATVRANTMRDILRNDFRNAVVEMTRMSDMCEMLLRQTKTREEKPMVANRRSIDDKYGQRSLWVVEGLNRRGNWVRADVFCDLSYEKKEDAINDCRLLNRYMPEIYREYRVALYGRVEI